MLKDFLKKNKGSISLYVLMAMMFFCIVIISLYTTNLNQAQIQRKQIEKIYQQYSMDDKLDQIYYETEQKTK